MSRNMSSYIFNTMKHTSMATATLFLALLAAPHHLHLAVANSSYADALTKSILFFEAQRSGKLPSNQRADWRSDSGLNDGKASGVDLSGGYYDAGDNVKFGFPMAFTITMLSWSVIEYEKELSSNGEIGNALDAIKWGTNYLIKAHPESDVLYGKVGDGYTDHECWQRPEDMTTDRTAYKIDASNPGTELAGETAAALAAASIAFRSKIPSYSATLLTHALQLFDLADKHRGSYASSIPKAGGFYNSFSGYNDELLWAAAWLYKATIDQTYLDYLGQNADSLGGTSYADNIFSWDNKYPGVYILISNLVLQGKAGQFAEKFEKYQQAAENFVCGFLGKGSKPVQKSPAGYFIVQSGINSQYVATASFVLTVYSDYLSAAGKTPSCGAPADLLSAAKAQVDYILGENPKQMSYMVGYGGSYPQHVHHRGASIVSIKKDPAPVECKAGFGAWFDNPASNQNVIVGAIVGGPDASDDYPDDRHDSTKSEPTTYINAPFVGVLARLTRGA